MYNKIALPLSPTLSTTRTEGECCCVPSLNFPSNIRLNFRKSLQTISSSIEFRRKINIIGDAKRSRSQNEIKTADDDVKLNIIVLLEDMIRSSKRNESQSNELNSKLLEPDTEKDIDHTNIKENDVQTHNCIDELDVNGLGNSKDDTICSTAPLIASERELDYIIKKWCSKINIKIQDLLGCYHDRGAILGSASAKIKSLILNKPESSTKLKTEILNVMEDLPIKDRCNVRSYVNKLFDVLFNRTTDSVVECTNENRDKQENDLYLLKRKEKIILTEVDLKNIVEVILHDFSNKSNSGINEIQLQTLKDALVDKLFDSVDCRRQEIDTLSRDKIHDVLIDLGQITEEQASNITQDLLLSLKEKFENEEDEDIFYNTYTVLPVPNYGCFTEEYECETDNILPKEVEGFKLNLEQYTHQLSQQIIEWLVNLNLPQILHQGISKIIANDLAEEIIDRHNYLKLNPSSRGSDTDELEQLKFQIFKSMNKAVGENITETLEHAQELMDKIKSIPVPSMTNSRKRKAIISDDLPESTSERGYIAKDYYDITKCHIERELINRRLEHDDIFEIYDSFPNSDNEQPIHFSQNMKVSNFEIRDGPRRQWSHSLDAYTKPLTRDAGNKSMHDSILLQRSEYQHNQKPPVAQERDINAANPSLETQTIPIPKCCSGKDPSSVSESVKSLTEEYDNYLRQWLLEIPIMTTNIEEEKLAKQARLGIYNGIWKAITKLKFDPEVNNNPYYYQDMLDDEIDVLLGYLPETEELHMNKQSLKARLITKTIITSEQIKAVSTPSWYKKQLVSNLDNHLPKTTKLRQDEEIKKHEIIEDYILFTRYKDENKLKSNVYRTNFLKNIGLLADSVKKHHENEFKDVDQETYVNELISAISKVPVPDSAAVRIAADKILIGKEVDHWLTDLPLNVVLRPLEKLRIRDAVADKINEIDKRMNLSDCNAWDEMQKILPKQLDRLSLRSEADVKFLIEELVNRIRNIPKDIRRRSVSFQVPNGYDEFSRDLPGCSSFQGPTDYSDDSSYMVNEEEMIRHPVPENYSNYDEPTVSEQQWLSMEESKTPSALRNWSSLPTTARSRNLNQRPYRGIPTERNLELQGASTSRDSYTFVNDLRDPFPTASSLDRKPTSSKQTSSRPVSATTKESSIPRQRANKQLMRNGRIGILGTSQTAGSSQVSEQFPVQPPRTPNREITRLNLPKASERTKSNQNISTDASPTTNREPEFFLSTDSEGIRRTINQNRKRNDSQRTDAVTMTTPGASRPVKYAHDQVLSDSPRPSKFTSPHDSFDPSRPADYAEESLYNLRGDLGFECPRRGFCTPQAYPEVPLRYARLQRQDDFEDDERYFSPRCRCINRPDYGSREDMYNDYPECIPIILCPFHY